ncbi:hypothetical protein QFZ20_000846 [Flavobacterium sp. W4I14]|nr:hypothetical protein [Flavobacterium sp. W4I14]
MEVRIIGIGKDKRLKEILTAIHSDIHMTSTDIALLHALITYYIQDGQGDFFQISRSGLMRISKILSTRTYHKSIKKLIRLGYILYEPSYHPKFGSRVSWADGQGSKKL